MSQTQLKKVAFIVAVMLGATFVINSVGRRVPAVANLQSAIARGV